MPKKEFIRTYVLSDADLIQRADALAQSITRDAAAFAVRGVDEARVEALIAARDAFDNFPTDAELRGMITSKNEQKAASRHDLEIALRRVRRMAEVQFEDGGVYKAFGIADLTRQTDVNLHRLARRVVRVATTLLPQLAAQGLTALQVEQLAAKAESFFASIDAMDEAEEARILQTQERVRLGNLLFRHMAELALIGKSIFEDTDEARYNDYIINDTAPAKAGAAG